MALYKPVMDHGGGGVVNPTGNTIKVTDPSGKVIYTGNALKGTEGSKWLLPVGQIPPGSQFSIDGGAAHIIPDPTMRNVYGDEGGQPTQVGGRGSAGSAGYVGANQGAYGMLPNPGMINFQPINYNPIKYNPIKTAPYTFVDPIAAAGRYNTFNTAAENTAYNTGKQRGTELTNLDTDATINFANRMEGTQQSLVNSENRFNQAQRLGAIDFAMPDLRSSLDAKKSRADTYASGRLLSSAEDRAYEVAARSASADGSFQRGFGDDSVFGKRTSDLLSAQQRLGISQMGEGMLNDWVSQGSSLLVDTPLKTSISQRLPSVPGILPSQQASQQQNALTSLTTLSPQFGISSEINQNQFATNLEQGTRQFNAGNTLGTSEFNASNKLGADEFNSSGAFQASQAQFGGLQTNYQLATQASNRAEDIQRQDDQNKAASIAANQNIGAQQTAANAGTLGQIGGAIVGGAITAATGGMFGGGGGGGMGAIGSVLGAIGLSQPVSGGAMPQFGGSPNVSNVASGIKAFSESSPVTGGQSLTSTMGSAPASGGSAAPQDAGSPVSAGGTAQATGQTASGGPTHYSGAAIPVQSGPYDTHATAADVASGMQTAGDFIRQIGNSGPSTPQISALGAAIKNGSAAAASITSGFQNAATPEAQMALANQLHGAANSNAPTPETKETVDQIFSQVKEHLETGAGVKGQAAGIAGFIKHYDTYNGPEKARGVANIAFAGQDLVGQYGVKDLSASSLAKVAVPGTNNKMSLQDAMSLSNSGYNVSSLVNNWDEIEQIHSTVNGKGNVLGIAATARNMGLLDKNTPDMVNATLATLKSVGASPAGAWGTGAVTMPAYGQAAAEKVGYAVVGKTNDGQVVALPKEAAASAGLSMGIIGSGVSPDSLKNSAPNTLAVSHSASQVYDSWSKDYVPKTLASMGATPGVASGLYQLGNKDPFLLGHVIMGSLETGQVSGAVMGGAAMAAKNPTIRKAAEFTNLSVGPTAIAAEAISKFGGGGKSSDQASRDALRSTAQHLGLVDKDFNVTLASGEKFNIGVDGHGGQREWHDPSLRRPDQTGINKLGAYDLDYTRDLDAVTNVGGNALAMLMYGGGDDQNVRKMGNYFTNAAVSDSGTPSLTQQGFSTAQSNLQGFFKGAGITSKSDAYALSNQMFHEGRVSQTQLVTIQQGINLAFDQNAFQGANQLLEGVKLGRKGSDAVATKSPVPGPSTSPVDQQRVSEGLVPNVTNKRFASPAITVKPPSQPIEFQNGR